MGSLGLKQAYNFHPKLCLTALKTIRCMEKLAVKAENYYAERSENIFTTINLIESH